MGEVVLFDAASKRLPSPAPQPAQQLPYETYIAYRQAEAAFRAIYFGRLFDLEAIMDRPSDKIVEQHWSTVEQLAEALQRKTELSRQQVTKLLLRPALMRPWAANRDWQDTDVQGTHFGRRHRVHARATPSV